MIRHLSRAHSVAVASLAFSRREVDEGAGLADYCDCVIAEILPEPIRWVQAVAALPTRLPSSVAYFWSAELSRKIQKLWHSEGFDAVMVHCAFMGQFVRGLRFGFGILDFGDLDSGKWMAYSRIRRWPLSMGYHFEARKLQRYEAELARQFHQCTVTTQGEMEEFRRLGVRTPSTVIPNGVDVEYFESKKEGSHGSNVIVFLGRMDYFPNIDGVCHFVKEILPTIQRAVPNVQFRIVGSNPVERVRSLGRLSGVVVTGHVADVRAYMADAAVSVAPLRVARGTQNKMLESMAMGIPVVATSEAAKGIHAAPDEHFLVADTPDDFARKVINVIQDGALRRNLVLSGRRQVEKSHSWETSMSLLDKVVGASKLRH